MLGCSEKVCFVSSRDHCLTSTTGLATYLQMDRADRPHTHLYMYICMYFPVGCCISPYIYIYVRGNAAAVLGTSSPTEFDFIYSQ